MVLKAKTTAEAEAVMNGTGATTINPAYETEAETQAETGSTAAADTATQEATTAIAKAASTSMVTSGDVFGGFLPTEMKDLLASLDFGVLPRVIADQGGLSIANEKIDLGKFITGQILQVQNSFIASPGADTEEAKKLVKYSRDGLKLDDDGGDARAYIEHLRLEGYKDASLKHYLNVTVLLGSTEDADAGEDFVGTVVVVQMSPESRKKFQRYMVNAQMKSIMTKSLGGLDQAKFLAVKKTGNGRNWTEIDTQPNKA